MKFIMSRCCGHIIRRDLPVVQLPQLARNIAPVSAPSLSDSFQERRKRARLSRMQPIRRHVDPDRLTWAAARRCTRGTAACSLLRARPPTADSNANTCNEAEPSSAGQVSCCALDACSCWSATSSARATLPRATAGRAAAFPAGASAAGQARTRRYVHQLLADTKVLF